MIDGSSFSSIWYWIALAVLWSAASHYAIGVPYDLAVRAGKQGGQKMQDIEDLTRINVNRLMNIAHVTGLFNVALTATGLTTLFIMGVFYDIEFAQALFFLVFPMSIVALMNISTALKIHKTEPQGIELVSHLKKHRFKTQCVGIASIFITAMWGMYQNIVVGPFG